MSTEEEGGLTHSVEIVLLRKLAHKLDKLVLVDEHAARRIKDDIASRLASDLEGERGMVGIRECQINVLHVLRGSVGRRLVDELIRQHIPAGIGAAEVRGLDLDV